MKQLIAKLISPLLHQTPSQQKSSTKSKKESEFYRKEPGNSQGITCYSNSDESERPDTHQIRYDFKVSDYYFMRNNKGSIDSSRDTLLDNNRRNLTYSMFHNVIATDKYCLFNRSGNPIHESVLWRGKAGVDQKFPCGNLEPISLSKKSKKKLTTAVWLRYCHFFHFGHLLTETCSALYPLILWKEAGLDIEPINLLLHYQFRKSVEDIKILLDISGKNIYIHGPFAKKDFRINHLYVPHPTIALKDYSGECHPYVAKKFLDLWAPKVISSSGIASKEHEENTQSDDGFKPIDKSNGNPQIGNDRLWISRSQLIGNSRALADEAHIERELSKLGWNIIHPQEHPIRTQLEALEKARIVSGVEGSAFHLLYGIQETEKLVMLLTWRDHEGGPFDIQLQSQGFKFQMIRCLHLSNGASKFRPGYDANSIITLISRAAESFQQLNPSQSSVIGETF